MMPQITKNILIINIFMMIIMALREEFMISTFALFYPASPYFHWWQPLTHMFMHGGWMHLFFNMFALVMFGGTLERQWGPKKYLFFYLLAGLGAAAIHMAVMWCQVRYNLNLIADGGLAAQKAMVAISRIKGTPMVGASGAIYGLLMGYAMLFPDTRLTLIFPPVTLTAKWWVVIWVAIELFTGFSSNLGGGVAHFAHLGGMLFGFIIIKIWKKKGIMYDYYQN